MSILRDMKKLEEILLEQPYDPDRPLISPDFARTMRGLAIEAACEGMRTWLSLADRRL